MAGVDILATQEVAIEFAFNWTVCWIVVTLFGLIGLIIGVVSVVRDGCSWIIMPIFMVMLAVFGGGLFGILIGNGLAKPVAYETRYKVTISDEVSMTDFLEKYEIVSTEGKIYTVREVKGE